MIPEEDFEVRLGRIRSRGAKGGPSFLNRALAAAGKAGGMRRGQGSASGLVRFGRGRAAALAAARRLGARSRSVVVKARVVRHIGGRGSLTDHLSYLGRDGVTKNGEPGRLFGAEQDEADHKAFAERSAGDRHHFRFIVAPEDATELSDLKAFTRDLMGQAERDLGTRLDWVAVEHWNTERPHIHVIVRGRADDGQDLVISRDYIREGMRARAGELVTLELGQRTDHEIRRDLDRQAEADRWTKLDRVLVREAAERGGVIDLRPSGELGQFDAVKIARLRKLERLGLAEPLGPARWRVSQEAEPTLRELGERDDIIKRLHRAMAEQGAERSPSDYVLDSAANGSSVLGRLAARGLDDELKGTAFVVIDGVDGRLHHVRLPSLESTGDSGLGAIVEARWTEPRDGARSRLVLALRSDLSLDQQVRTEGATWLDRQLLASDRAGLTSSGFGRDVEKAMEGRIGYLAEQGLAEREGRRVRFSRDLLKTLRDRELERVAGRIAAETQTPHRRVADGDAVEGVFRRRLNLASGRFAMIDDGLGFSLVPWRPDLERERGRQVSGIALPGGGIDWSLGRKRGIGR